MKTQKDEFVVWTRANVVAYVECYLRMNQKR